MSILKNTLALCFCGLLSVGASAQQNTSLSANSSGATFTTPVWASSNASDWGVSDSQWARYKELMKGEAGLYYAHLEPAFVLGIYAKDEAERSKMARIVYKAEHARTKKLFDFNRAYTKVAMFSGDSSFDSELQKEYDLLFKSKLAGMSLIPPKRLKSKANSRQVLVVKPDCGACDEAMRKLVSNNHRIDVYFVGAADAQIREWANKLKLPVESVKSGNITLNHDAKDWFGDITSFPIQYDSGVNQ